jgi:Tol biopolymer transport system component
MIFDVKSKRVVDYCLEGYSYDAPGWSPDSTQIVVESADIDGILLLDLPTNRSFKLVDIPNVSYPGMWMYSIPDKGQ